MLPLLLRLLPLLGAAVGALAAIGLVLLAYRRWRCERLMGERMARPPEWPLLGVAPHFIGKDNEAVLAQIHALFGGQSAPIRAWFGPVLVIGVSHPDDMQVVLSSPDCLQKGYMYKFMHNANGLFTSDVGVWRQHRRHLNPTFSAKSLLRYVPVINAKASRMCDRIAGQMAETQQRRRPLNIYNAIFLCTLDITVNTVMSMPGTELQNAAGERFHDAFVAAFESVASRMYRAWQIPDCIYRRTAAWRLEMEHFRYGHAFIDDIIARKRQQLRAHAPGDLLAEEHAAGTLSFVHKCFWLRERGHFTEAELRDEVETILIGGIDTTSVTVTHVALMLAIHADVQARCLAELEQVFGRERWWQRDAELTIGQDDVAALVYMKRVVQESLRLWPAGPLLSRQCGADVRLKNATIPSGSVILLLISQLHRDAEHWGPDAGRFDPDRFLPERCAGRHPWAFLPYSGGPRNCIGIRQASVTVCIMLAQLLRRYRLGSALRLQDVRIRMDITSKVVNVDPMWLEHRELPADMRRREEMQ